MGSQPAAPARKTNWSTPLLFLSFALVFLVLFNPELRDATGRWVGYALDPVIGFDNRYPVLTIFFASVLLVIGTTTIRHFLVDWTMMARTQEVMRTFQKEFAQARKDNNTYKMKKLTEAQPKVFELQAGLQKDQLKPMAFTMLIVIPLFAWLGTHLAHPVAFELEEAPETPVALMLTRHGAPWQAVVADDARIGERIFDLDVDMYGFVFAAPGAGPPSSDIYVRDTETSQRFFIHAADAVEVPEAARESDLAAGNYTFAVAEVSDEQKLTLTGENGFDVTNVGLVFVTDGEIVRALAADRTPRAVTLDAPATLYVVVPDLVADGAVEGSTTLHVTGAATEDIVVDAANVIEPAHAQSGPPVYPFSAKLPWQDVWSLQAFWWILPHWILLYSLFGIPFGQIAQRALKLWEYRHVDLDNDGREAGDA